MAKTRAIRLSNDETEKIEIFLKQNPIFDFSTLARHAIFSFIENPSIKLKSVSKAKRSKEESNERQQ